MFSGIIEHQGHVSAARRLDRDLDITVATGIPDLSLGESIAVNGVCLTVTSFDAAGNATFFISSETLDRTALGRIGAGHTVNLERAVTPATRLSGHIVQGHVDGTGTCWRWNRQARPATSPFPFLPGCAAIWWKKGRSRSMASA